MTPKPHPDLLLRAAKILLKIRKPHRDEEREVARALGLSHSATHHLILHLLDKEVEIVDPQYIPEHLGDN